MTGVEGREEETFGDIESGEEDCFKHSMGFSEVHMLCRQCDWRCCSYRSYEMGKRMRKKVKVIEALHYTFGGTGTGSLRLAACRLHTGRSYGS